MLTKVNLVKIIMGFSVMAASVTPQLSYADWSIGIGVGDRHDDGWDHRHEDHWDHHEDHWDHHEHYYRWHDHPHYGYHFHYLPAGFYTIWVGGVKYYYYDGLYYIYAGDGDYVMVNPPVGAYVNAIPPDFQPVFMNGRTYYTDNGIYYILTQHHGYKVVSPPIVVYDQPAQVIVQPPPPPEPAPVNGQDSFPINIPNNSGGYTAVVIKKSGTGYVGPQGEFYQTFPSVAQLKAMYGSK